MRRLKTLGYMSLALSAALIVLPACGSGGGTGPYGNGNGDGNGDDGNGSGSAAATVTMDNVAYIDPDGNQNTQATVTIQVGETVRWVNNDDVSHTVDSGEGQGGSDGDGIPDGAGNVLASGNIGPGGSYEFTFNTAGTWTYYCEIHPGQMYDATVIVEE